MTVGQLARSMGTRTDRWRWGWPGLAAVAAVANLTFLLRRLVGSSLAPASTEISALSVPGQPLAWSFRTGDAVFGIATALLALGVARHPAPWRRSGTDTGTGTGTAPVRFLVAGLVVSGLANVLAALVPESSTSDGGTTDLLGSAADVVHGAASLVAGIGLVLGVVGCAGGLLRPDSARGTSRPQRTERTGRPLTTLLAVALAVVLVALSAAEVVGAASGGVSGSGVVQRVQVACSSVWTVLVGVLVGRARARGVG